MKNLTEKMLHQYIKAEVDRQLGDIRVRMARLEKSSGITEFDELDRLFPGWQEVVGQPGEAKPFRAWLENQDQDYRATINNTRDPALIVGAINTFMAQNKLALS